MTGRSVKSAAKLAPVRGRGRQVAALCWRTAPMLQVLLVTSLRTRRWILPKGWPMSGESSARSAAIEALEEAGVAGDIGEAPIGRYHYTKEKKNRGIACGVDVYPLHVRHQLLTWPERGRRETVWLPIAEAALRVGEPELRQILLAFRRTMAE
jgi:8-oxo-dGTP pyrophosphatase MutT (NUDIX family)